MRKIELEFKGFKREVNKDFLEEKAGIYCVYRCIFDGTYVDLKELLYIGQADNIHDRLTNHEKLPDWKRCLNRNETLCYSRAFVDDEGLRLRAEAALIFRHKPPENKEHVNNFGYPDTEMVLTGKTGLLEEHFIVRN